MKLSKIFRLMLTLSVCIACVQKEDVPIGVSKTFAQKFPKVKNVTWDKENGTEWEAEFNMNSISYSANFDVDGNWIETEHKIEMSEVPESIKFVLVNEYPEYNVRQTEICETINGMFYEFEIYNGTSDLELFIYPNGNVSNKKERK